MNIIKHTAIYYIAVLNFPVRQSKAVREDLMDEINEMNVSELMLNLWEASYCTRREAKEQQEDDEYNRDDYYDDMDSRMHVISTEMERSLLMLKKLGTLIKEDGSVE